MVQCEAINDDWRPMSEETPLLAHLFCADKHCPQRFRLRAARNGDGGRPLVG
jgi:hypothetical protein